MQQPQEPVLDEDELIALAKLLDVLMEVDFEQTSNEGLTASVS
jgi:hypothetical protein